MSNALQNGAIRLAQRLDDMTHDYTHDIATDPGIKALVEACQYVADPCDQDFRTANDKAIDALETWETGK